MDLFLGISGSFGISKKDSSFGYLDQAKTITPHNMKNKIFVLLALVMLQACSSPRYSYYFSHDQYQYGQKKNASAPETSPLRLDPTMLEANASTGESLIDIAVVHEQVGSPSTPQVKVSKSERKAIHSQLKRELKPILVAEKKHAKEMATASGGMDKDLKLAAIFGVAGFVGLIIGGSVFNVLGGIALLIGLVFLIRWIIRQ